MRRICKYCGTEFDGYPGANACPDCVNEHKRNVIRDRVCQTCGVTFPGGPRAWYCPACREERRRQHDREQKQRQREGRVRSVGSVAYCERCGQPYTVNGGLQRYCPECAPVALKAAANAISRAWNAEHTTPEQRRAERHGQAAAIACKVCGRPFIPANAALTCSKACADALAARNARALEAKNRDARNACRRRRYADRLAAMTEDERREYREKVNARARASYRARKEKGIGQKGIDH